MGNSKLPAYPIASENGHYNGHADFDGFTKLELASLMIAQGLVGKYSINSPSDQKIIAELSVELADEILREANK